MTAASANKVTVPGDNRLDELKLGNKTPFWHKIPIIKELRVAVGWQKGMLITVMIGINAGFHACLLSRRFSETPRERAAST